MFDIVFGVICLAAMIVHIIKVVVLYKANNNIGDRLENSTRRNCCEVVSVIFLAIWFVVGTFFTFRAWKDWTANGSVACSGSTDISDCCDPGIMYFSVVSLVLMFITTASSIAIGCCCFCFIACLARSSK